MSDGISDVCSSDLLVPLLCRERWAGQLFLNFVKQIYISTCGRGLEPVDHVQIWLPFELPKENFGQLLESVSNYGKQFGITPFETCIVVKFVYEAQIAAVVENPGPKVGGNIHLDRKSTRLHSSH